ncbi:hypothetical protein AUJ10_00170 [Candidatus Pacearchaeota archaeon CG1_02_31_27]|nr:MAG: hypothetical protein AUJ10_00170 [Candidatus Pacearchaeota archaeon CG1_02_31_27]
MYYKNVEFRLGDIEELPIENNSINIILSNCVINLSPDKDKVFSESYRVLKKGGKMFISDMVLTGELTEEQKKDEGLLTACVSGALQKEDYLDKIKKAGFDVTILDENRGISERQYQKLPVESLKFKAVKVNLSSEELCCADKNVCSVDCELKEDSESKRDCGGCCL